MTTRNHNDNDRCKVMAIIQMTIQVELKHNTQFNLNTSEMNDYTSIFQ